MKSVLNEFRKMVARRGAQFVPIGIPTVSSCPNTKYLYLRLVFFMKALRIILVSLSFNSW